MWNSRVWISTLSTVFYLPQNKSGRLWSTKTVKFYNSISASPFGYAQINPASACDGGGKALGTHRNFGDGFELFRICLVNKNGAGFVDGVDVAGGEDTLRNAVALCPNCHR